MRTGFSKATVGLGIYIVISAAFMLQVRDRLFSLFGGPAVMAVFKTLFVLVAFYALIYAFRKNPGVSRFVIAAAVLIAAYIFSARQPYFSEKSHVLTYGILGYLAARDMAPAKNKIRLKNIAIAAGFICAISALDEGFQGILPYRFAETRDFVTNIISGSMGMAFFSCLPREL